LRMATKLRERGLFIPAIRYPTVARGAARLRVTMTAAHSAQDTQDLLSGLGDLGLELPAHASPG
jgi:8-amino-7-oxononanoate synthase